MSHSCSRSTSSSLRATDVRSPRSSTSSDLAGNTEETIIGTWLGVDGPLLAMLVQERIDAYTALAASGSTVTSAVREAVRFAAARVPVAIVSVRSGPRSSRWWRLRGSRVS